MKFKQSFLAIFVLFTVNFKLDANTFLSFPGARARAMGGAFTAVANDASAVWYNPAGIASKGSDIILEGGQAAGVDVDLDAYLNGLRFNSNGELEADPLNRFNYEANRVTWFVGGKWNKGGKSNWSLGAFMYQPYTFDWFYTPDLNRTQSNSLFGRLEQELRIYGLAPAISFNGGRIKLGATLELVRVNYKNSELVLQRPIGNRFQFSRVNVSDDENASGFSGSAGILLDLLSAEMGKRGIWLKGGFTYRAKSKTDLDDEVENTVQAPFLPELLFEKPNSWDAGLAFTKSFAHKGSSSSSRGSALTIAVQQGTSDFGSANDRLDLEYDMTNAGLEYMIIFSSANALALRAGTYRSDADLETWPDISALTGGIEFKVGKKWSLSAAHEIRTLKATAVLEERDVNLTVAAINYSF